MTLHYLAESRGYTVMDGERFLGRVGRIRNTYDHSNGRTYRSWVWAAYPVDGKATFHHRTREKAARALTPEKGA